MTIYRENCWYRRPTPEELLLAGLDEFWLVETRPDGSEAFIPDTCARLAATPPGEKPTIIVGTVQK